MTYFPYSASPPSGGGSGVIQTDRWDGDDSTTTFVATSTVETNGTLYVALNGIIQDPDTYTITINTLETLFTPASTDSISWAYYTTIPETITLATESFTGVAETDFELTNTPISGGVLYVAVDGVISSPTNWSVIAPKTIRFTSEQTAEIIIGYAY